MAREIWLSRFLLCFLCIVPFVQPFRYYPEGDFVGAWLAIVALLLFLVIQLKNSQAVMLTAPMLSCVFLALLCLWWLGVVAGIAVAAFFLLVALLFAVGHDGWGRYLPLVFVLIGLLNVVAGLIQASAFEKYFHPWVYSSFSLGFTKTVYGNVGQRNLFTLFVFLGLTSFSWLWARRELTVARGLLFLAFAACCAYVMALAGSRSVILFMACALLATALGGWWHASIGVRRSFVAKFFIFLVAGAALILLFQFSVTNSGAERISQSATQVMGDVHRFHEWKTALRIGADAFPWGVGWGGYGQARYLYALSDPDAAYLNTMSWEHSHNIFLQLFVELGVFALPLYLFIGYLIFKVVSLRGEAWFFFVIVLGCFFIQSNLEYPLWYVSFFVLFSVVVLALNWSGVRVQMPRAVRDGLLLALFVALGFQIFTLRQYVSLVLYTDRFVDSLELERRKEDMLVIAKNPMLEFGADLMMMNYYHPGEGRGRLMLCRTLRMMQLKPARELLDRAALEAFAYRDASLGLSLIKSRLAVYPGFPLDPFMQSLSGFEADYRTQVVGLIEKAMQNGFHGVEDYRLTLPEDCTQAM